VWLAILLAAQGSGVDLGGGGGSALGAADLNAAKLEFEAGRYGTALARASQITSGGASGELAVKAGILQASAAVQLKMPRLAVLLVAPYIGRATPSQRAGLLKALGPLFESPITAPELARVLKDVPAEELSDRWRPYFGYYAARAVIVEEVMRRDAAAAPRERERGLTKGLETGAAADLENSGGLDLEAGNDKAPAGTPTDGEASSEGAVDGEGQAEESTAEEIAEAKSAAATAKIAAAEAEGKARAAAKKTVKKVSSGAQVAARARGLLGYVPRGHRLEGKAQLQAGLAATLEDDDETALGHFQTALRVGNREVRDAALMQLARVHYAHGQMRAALNFYRQIPAASPDWPRALFEQAWAQYQRGNFGRVLGILEAFESPFLSDEIIEEIEVLKALSFYENCRYDDAVAGAKRVLDKRPVFRRLTSALGEVKEGAAWLSLYRRRDQLEDEVLRRRLMFLARRPGIKRSVAIFEGAEAEYSRLLGAGLQPNDLRRLEGVFRQRFSELRDSVGGMVRAEVLAQQVSLANLLKSALALQVEIEEQRTKVLQQKLRGGTGGVIAVPTGEPIAVSDDYTWWPFDGEYWRDELETYEVHLGSSCR